MKANSAFVDVPRTPNVAFAVEELSSFDRSTLDAANILRASESIWLLLSVLLSR